MRDISRLLGRSVSTISDEITRNKVRGNYDSKKAQHKAYVRRKYAKYQGKKIVDSLPLREFVEDNLLDDQSPEAIAGRLDTQTALPAVSNITIRHFIASPYGRRIEYIRYLRRLNRRRRRRAKTASLLNRRSIDQRPQTANLRHRVGDAEGDFIESGKDGTGKLLVIVDRKLRTTFITQLRKPTNRNLLRALRAAKRRFPEWRTLTCDNDILLRDHQRFEKILGITIYFCHPYSSWEKGTVENSNKYIRRDIPKGSAINSYSPRFVRAVEEKLNRRFMACLKHLTPQEALDRYRGMQQKSARKGARKRKKKK